MFKEENYEMEQLLKSIAKIDKARKECERNFESHIWLDDGVKGTNIILLFVRPYLLSVTLNFPFRYNQHQRFRSENQSARDSTNLSDEWNHGS